VFTESWRLSLRCNCGSNQAGNDLQSRKQTRESHEASEERQKKRREESNLPCKCSLLAPYVPSIIWLIMRTERLANEYQKRERERETRRRWARSITLPPRTEDKLIHREGYIGNLPHTWHACQVPQGRDRNFRSGAVRTRACVRARVSCSRTRCIVPQKVINYSELQALVLNSPVQFLVNKRKVMSIKAGIGSKSEAVPNGTTRKLFSDAYS